jgi:hypothetical protein
MSPSSINERGCVEGEVYVSPPFIVQGNLLRNKFADF